MKSQYTRSNLIVSEALSSVSMSRFLLSEADEQAQGFDFSKYESEDQNKIKAAFSNTIKTIDSLIKFINGFKPEYLPPLSPAAAEKTEPPIPEEKPPESKPPKPSDVPSPDAKTGEKPKSRWERVKDTARGTFDTVKKAYNDGTLKLPTGKDTMAEGDFEEYSSLFEAFYNYDDKFIENLLEQQAYDFDDGVILTELFGFGKKKEPAAAAPAEKPFKNVLALLKLGSANLSKSLSDLNDVESIERFWAAQQFFFSFANLLNGLSESFEQIKESHREQGEDENMPLDMNKTLEDLMGQQLSIVANSHFTPKKKQRDAIQRMVDFFAKDQSIIASAAPAGPDAKPGHGSPGGASTHEAAIAEMERKIEALLHEAETNDGEEKGIIAYVKNLFKIGSKASLKSMGPLFGKDQSQIAKLVLDDLKKLRLVDFQNFMTNETLKMIFAKMSTSAKSIDPKATTALLGPPVDPELEELEQSLQNVSFNKGMAKSLRASLYQPGKDNIINLLIDMFDMYNAHEEVTTLEKLRRKPELFDRAVANVDRGSAPESLRNVMDAGVRVEPSSSPEAAARAAGIAGSSSKYIDKEEIKKYFKDLSTPLDDDGIEKTLQALVKSFGEDYDKEVQRFYESVLSRYPGDKNKIKEANFDDILEKLKKTPEIKEMSEGIQVNIQKKIKEKIIQNYNEYYEKNSKRKSESTFDRWSRLAGLVD